MTKRRLVALLALLGCFLAAYLALYKLGYIAQLVCAMSSCERVNMSRWAVFLGVPVAIWGLLFYATLAVALVGTMPRYAEERRISALLVGLSGWGVLFTAYLTSLEAFVIHAYCMYCLTSAVLVSTMFALSLLDLRHQRLGRWATSGPLLH